MSSFELVNHQLKHMFGGIEAQKNSSLQYLETCQKKVVKSMQKAQANHLKIYQSLLTIKTCFRELHQNYLSLERQNKSDGGLLSKISHEINNFIQDFSEESLSLSKKMEAKVENFAPNLKKVKQKFTECAQNLQHYRKKVGLLQKGVQKQSLANIKVDEHERFQRNKDKLRKAQKEHDQMLIKTTKQFVEFNSEGMKDIYNDFISLSANLVSNIMQVSNNLTKHLVQHFAAHQNIITKQIKMPKKEVEQSKKKQSVGEWVKGQSLEYRQHFIEHLVQEKHIASYLKKIVDRQTIRQQNEKIQQIFRSRKVIDAPDLSSSSQESFHQFKNIYNNHELKNHKILEKVKEQDPIQACEDLLQMDQPNEVSQAISQDIQMSSGSPEKVGKEIQDKRKDNLQKFNKICQKNKIQRHKSPNQHIKPAQKSVSPNLKAIQFYKTSSHHTTNKTTLKSPDQFFNLSYFDQQKPNAQQKLSNLHEHAFQFDLLSTNNPNSNRPPLPSTKNSNNSSFDKLSFKQTSSALNFDNFDLLITDNTKNNDAKTKMLFGNNIGLSSKHQPKQTTNNMNLLNL